MDARRRADRLDQSARRGRPDAPYPSVRIGGVDRADVAKTVRMVRVTCRYGGSRRYFVCPGVVNGVPCGRRVTKLHLSGRHSCAGIVTGSATPARARTRRIAPYATPTRSGSASVAILAWPHHSRRGRKACGGEPKSACVPAPSPPRCRPTKPSPVAPNAWPMARLRRNRSLTFGRTRGCVGLFQRATPTSAISRSSSRLLIHRRQCPRDHGSILAKQAHHRASSCSTVNEGDYRPSGYDGGSLARGRFRPEALTGCVQGARRGGNIAKPQRGRA